MRTSGRASLSDARDAADQAAAADRDDHRGESGDVLEQLEAERRLAGDRRAGRRTGARTSAPVWAARSRARATHSSTESPPRWTMPPKPRTAATLATDALGGHEDLARRGRARGRRRRADCAWLPALPATTPGALARRPPSLASAPRSLNEPVRWRFSALTRIVPPHCSPRLRLVRTGVWRTRSAIRSRAVVHGVDPEPAALLRRSALHASDISGSRRPGNRDARRDAT